MSEATPAEFLQPALLDRIAPDPDIVGSQRDRLGMIELRGLLVRDLHWLLNTQAAPADNDIWDFPRVARSVLNFGLPPLTGRTVTSMSDAQLSSLIRKTIVSFEPRILESTLTVRVRGADGEGERERSLGSAVERRGEVPVEIHGEFCPLPVPEAMTLRARLELDTCHFVLGGQPDE